MPQRIEVPGMGVVEFPDGMNDDQIASAIKQSMPQQSVIDKLTGTNGPRYQTWPERAARGLFGAIGSGATLPGDVYSGRTPVTGPDGSTNPEVIDRSADLAALAAPVNPGVRAGDRAIAGLSRARMVPESTVKPPTAEALKAAANKGYDAARNMGVEVRGDAVGGMAQGLKADLEADGIFAELAPKTFSVISRAASPPQGSMATVANLEAFRRSLQRAAQDFSNPTEQLAASRAIKGLDGFLETLPSGSVVARPPSAAPGVVALPSPVPSAGPAEVASTLRTARQNYGAAQRSNDLTGVLDRANTGILERAEARSQAANSGRNLDNTIRQRIASLLEKPKEVSGYSDKELSALNGVLQGGPARNSARYVGNFLGGGGGIGQFGVGAVGAGMGGAFGGIPGAVVGATPAVAGASAKMIANLLAKRSLNKADEVVRSNSPLFQDMLKSAPMKAAGLEKRAAIVRALMALEENQ